MFGKWDKMRAVRRLLTILATLMCLGAGGAAAAGLEWWLRPLRSGEDSEAVGIPRLGLGRRGVEEAALRTRRLEGPGIVLVPLAGASESATVQDALTRQDTSATANRVRWIDPVASSTAYLEAVATGWTVLFVGALGRSTLRGLAHDQGEVQRAGGSVLGVLLVEEARG